MALLDKIPMPALYLLLFLSLLLLEFFNFHLSPDISNQLATLKNFSEGNGISIASLDQQNNIIYERLSLWPAGLVLLLTPFYLLTKSTVATALLLKFTANLFFIFFLGVYCKFLQLQDYKKKCILLFFSISVAPFIHFYPSDTVATVFCLWGFYFNLKYQVSQQYAKLFIAVALLALSYFVKYSFLPFLLYPIVSFLLKEGVGSFKKWKEFLVMLAFTCVVTVFVYALNNVLVGKSTVAAVWDAFSGNPHWQQLVRFDGFLFTFGNYEWAFENLVKNRLGLSFSFNWISLLVTGYFYILFLLRFFTKNALHSSRFKLSLNVSLSAGALIIFFLAILTINNPGQTWAIPYWTFVEESRYFAPVIVIGLINILCIFLSQKRGSLLSFVIPVMIMLNLLAYKFIVQNGSWGKSYKSYSRSKQFVNEAIPSIQNGSSVVVFATKESKNTAAYYYLMCQGVVMVDSSRYNVLNKNQLPHINYVLTQSAGGDPIIAPIL